MNEQGSNFVNIGPVTLGCISPEARDLLDTIMGAWEEHLKEARRHTPDYEPTPYGLVYWLVRWSGLVQAARGQDEQAN